MARPRRYPEELIERAVRMALESNRPIAHVAADLGMDGERLRRYVKQLREAGGCPSRRPRRSGRRFCGCVMRMRSCAARMRS